MSKIAIGLANKRIVHLDLDILLTTRLLVTADSGGGKTVLLKRLAEQIFGKIPILILDPEGEFAPLREKFGFVLVGPGGETPADPRSAALVAQTLLKLKASAICDIYEMKPSLRHTFVKNFCDGLIDAPKTLWHPTIIIVDEAHMFCPEGKAGESEATDAVKSLSTRGRKRGICPIFATQRLAEFNKGASSMCLNRLVGGTFEDVNQKRALDVLSVANEDRRMILAEMKLLEPGDFYALGRAISKERILVHIGGITTPHGDQAAKYASVPPPAPEAIAKLLPQLSDLPKEAEEKAKTEAELRREIRELKTELRQKPVIKLPAAGSKTTVADPRAIERAVRETKAQAEKTIAIVHADAKAMHAHGGKLARALSELAAVAAKQFSGPVPRLPNLVLSQIPSGEIQKGEGIGQRQVAEPSGHDKPTARNFHPRSEPSLNGRSPYENSVLKGLAELYGIGRATVTLAMAAAAAGRSRSGAWDKTIAKLSRERLIDRPAPGMVALTDAGIEAAPQGVPAIDSMQLQARIRAVLNPYQRSVFDAALIYGNGVAVPLADLADSSGRAMSGAWDKTVASLVAMEILERPERGKVAAAKWLFLED